MKRNPRRFRSRFHLSPNAGSDSCFSLRSQFATSNEGRGRRRYQPPAPKLQNRNFFLPLPQSLPAQTRPAAIGLHFIMQTKTCTRACAGRIVLLDESGPPHRGLEGESVLLSRGCSDGHIGLTNRCFGSSISKNLFHPRRRISRESSVARRCSCAVVYLNAYLLACPRLRPYQRRSLRIRTPHVVIQYRDKFFHDFFAAQRALQLAVHIHRRDRIFKRPRQ